MNKIQFSTTKYDLVSPINRSSSDFQATIVKGDHTIDSIVNEAVASDVIKVYEDDVVVATYDGYTTFKAASTYVIDDEQVVSVEMLCTDMQTQINNMNSDITDIHQTQETQAQVIGNLSSSIDDLGISQSVQDLAIEDLGETVSELVEE